MGRSIIEYQSHGFWVPDVSMELTLFFLQKEIKENYSQESWLMEMHEQFKIMMIGAAPGNMELHLNKFLNNQNRIQQFIEVIENVKDLMSNFDGRVIPLSIANSYIDITMQNKWKAEPHIYEVISVLSVLRLLIEGKLLTTIQDDQFLFGY